MGKCELAGWRFSAIAAKWCARSVVTTVMSASVLSVAYTATAHASVTDPPRRAALFAAHGLAVEAWVMESELPSPAGDPDKGMANFFDSGFTPTL